MAIAIPRWQVEVPELTTLTAWVHEAMWASQEWRGESWRDAEMYDGGAAQWTTEDWEEAKAANINPITINRTFPTVNFILGSQVINKFDIMVKGRTVKDVDTANTMTEGVKFVMDQWGGEFLVSQAFRDQAIPGIGWLDVGLSHDPRRERIKVAWRDWKEVWWDPFSSPWVNPHTTRYVFHAPWVDVKSLMMLFPNKRKEIREMYDEMSGSMKEEIGSLFWDEATVVEMQTRMLAGRQWADADRGRIRPVKMWYPQHEMAWFSIFADGRVIEFSDDKKSPHFMEPNEQFDVITSAEETLQAVVNKMHCCTFMGQLELQRAPSPFPHDMYPLIPFVGYIDRYRFPYGVPRQLRGQDEEVNKRRSMALAMLKSRRVTIEENAVDGGRPALQNLYDEANKLDGFLVVKEGKMNAIKIDEMAQLNHFQIRLLEQSEREIREIAGPGIEQTEAGGKVQSGKALEKRAQTTATISAPLFENLRRSQGILGEQVIANMQGFWKGEKVLRITDRITGADRFVEMNKKMRTPSGIVIRNDITQGKYDAIVSESPQTDTVREQNMNLLIEWVKKSPPEAIPYILIAAFELSNIPNKEQLLSKIRPILGIPPDEENLSPEELKQKTLQALQQQQQAQAKSADRQEKAADAELEGMVLDNLVKRAELKKTDADIKLGRAKAVADMRRGDRQHMAEISRQNKESDDKRRAQILDFQKAVIKSKEGQRAEAG